MFINHSEDDIVSKKIPEQSKTSHISPETYNDDSKRTSSPESSISSRGILQIYTITQDRARRSPRASLHSYHSDPISPPQTYDLSTQGKLVSPSLLKKKVVL